MQRTNHLPEPKAQGFRSSLRLLLMLSVFISLLGLLPSESRAVSNSTINACSKSQMAVLRELERVVEYGARAIVRAYDGVTPSVRAQLNTLVNLTGMPGDMEFLRKHASNLNLGEVHCEGSWFCGEDANAVAVLDMKLCESFWGSGFSAGRQAAILFHEYSHLRRDTYDFYYDNCSAFSDRPWSAGALSNYASQRSLWAAIQKGDCSSNASSYSYRLQPGHGADGGYASLGEPAYPKSCSAWAAQNAWYCSADIPPDNGDTWEAMWWIAFSAELQSAYASPSTLNTPLTGGTYAGELALIKAGRDPYDEISCSFEHTNRSMTVGSYELDVMRSYEASYGPSPWGCDGLGTLQSVADSAIFDFDIFAFAETGLPPESQEMLKLIVGADAAVATALL